MLSAVCLLLHRELKHNVLACELLVDECECVQLCLHIDLVLGVQMHLQDLGAISLCVSQICSRRYASMWDLKQYDWV